LTLLDGLGAGIRFADPATLIVLVLAVAALVFAARRTDGAPGIAVAATDGSTIRWLELRGTPVGTVANGPAFRPIDGQEVLFLAAADPVEGGTSVHAVDLETGGTRTVVEATPRMRINNVEWSPTGSEFSYATWDSMALGLTARVHVASADGRQDRVLAPVAGQVWDYGSAWSNDGKRMLLIRGFTSEFPDNHLWIVPTDGSGPGREVEHDGDAMVQCCESWLWSPDDTMILGSFDALDGTPTEQVIVDVESATVRPVPWSANDVPTWQRVAP
jgi:dipeptidyl aminopeptidase/acylaminoacyl peptidase